MTICTHGIHTHHCDICRLTIDDVRLQSDYNNPEFVKNIERWGAVYWHRYCGRLWVKLVEATRANKALREEIENESK